MNDTWVISDTHFDHANILTFLDRNGIRFRGQFTDVNHMNQYMIDRWNSVVKPNDKVYHLGDFGYRIDKFILRLNGKKVLILGNHDKLKSSDYQYFKSIYSSRWMTHNNKKFVMCHYQLHPMSFDYRDDGQRVYCVHGHIHEKIVYKGNQPDPVYINVSVEQLDYTPINLDQLTALMK